jgi:hypothetical protein
MRLILRPSNSNTFLPYPGFWKVVRNLTNPEPALEQEAANCGCSGRIQVDLRPDFLVFAFTTGTSAPTGWTKPQGDDEL